MTRALDDPEAARAAEALGSWLDGRRPELLLTLGSGLADVADAVEDGVELTADEVPGLAASTVPGHQGRLVCGRLAGRTVLVQVGRLHLYEGHDAAAVSRLVLAAAQLGAQAFVVTNAAGGLVPEWSPGDLLVIADHLNLTGDSPLTGRRGPSGPPFVDMAAAYDPGMRAVAHEVGREEGLPLRTGVYAGLRGPSYETPAEVAMLRTLGAHAVGMSTVNEVIAARAVGLRVLGLSTITNVHGEGASTSHEEVLDVGRRAAADLRALVLQALPRL